MLPGCTRMPGVGFATSNEPPLHANLVNLVLASLRQARTACNSPILLLFLLITSSLVIRPGQGRAGQGWRQQHSRSIHPDWSVSPLFEFPSPLLLFFPPDLLLWCRSDALPCDVPFLPCRTLPLIHQNVTDLRRQQDLFLVMVSQELAAAVAPEGLCPVPDGRQDIVG